MTEQVTKRKRGRPVGSRDSKPRYRAGMPKAATDPKLTVEQKIGQLSRPMKVSVLANIFGMSQGKIRKNIKDGHLRAFHRGGMMLVEPADALTFWQSRFGRPTRKKTVKETLTVSTDPVTRLRQIREFLRDNSD